MFEVLWTEEAERQLAEIWIRAGNRGEITTAVASVDKRLKSDPGKVGESREDFERILFAPPLIVRFEVFEADRRVHVLNLRYNRKRDG